MLSQTKVHNGVKFELLVEKQTSLSQQPLLPLVVQNQKLFSQSNTMLPWTLLQEDVLQPMTKVIIPQVYADKQLAWGGEDNGTNLWTGIRFNQNNIRKPDTMPERYNRNCTRQTQCYWFVQLLLIQKSQRLR